MSKGRVVVAMSGGVDSSVAALLLNEQGYEVIGITMRLWSVERNDLPPLSKRCCSVEDVEDARRVCQIIGAPHYFMNFEQEFKKHVVDYFVQEYSRGRTPYPCLACNDKMKFDFLLRKALFLDADYIATGHYARIHPGGNTVRLLKAVDERKDQSYVLFTLGQPELRRLLLPIGEYRKDDVRELAAKAGLPVANKPDSQEICFIPDGDYRKFVGERASTRPGEVVDASGALLGTHPGIHAFTVGQRRGLGVNVSAGMPMYVTRIDAKANRVVLGSEDQLYRSTLWASRVNYVSDQPPAAPFAASVKIRYKFPACPATVVPLGDSVQIQFDQPQRAVTPGQAVVFYDGDEVVGGGTIELDDPVQDGTAGRREMEWTSKRS